MSARPSRGLTTLLVFVYGLFALSATARSLVQILREFDRAPVAYSLSLVAALTYIAVTLTFALRGPRSPLALALVIVELVGVVAVGTLTLADPALFPEPTVWSDFGIGYGFVPLVLPLAALAHIARSRRRAGRGQDSGPTAEEGR